MKKNYTVKYKNRLVYIDIVTTFKRMWKSQIDFHIKNSFGLWKSGKLNDQIKDELKKIALKNGFDKKRKIFFYYPCNRDVIILYHEWRTKYNCKHNNKVESEFCPDLGCGAYAFYY